MNRNLKVLGLAITAVLAMSAVWAVSAQATDPEIHCTSTTNTCKVTGNEITTHTLNFEGGNARCRSRLFATIAKTTATATANAEYTECRAFGTRAEVKMNGCVYNLANVAGSNPPTANVSVSCNGGRVIEIINSFVPCTIEVGTQGPLAHIEFTSRGTEPTHVNANITVPGIRYTMVQATCPRRGGVFNNGEYVGESTLEGFNDNGINDAEGSKVGLHVKPL